MRLNIVIIIDLEHYVIIRTFDVIPITIYMIQMPHHLIMSKFHKKIGVLLIINGEPSGETR